MNPYNDNMNPTNDMPSSQIDRDPSQHQSSQQLPFFPQQAHAPWPAQQQGMRFPQPSFAPYNYPTPSQQYNSFPAQQATSVQIPLSMLERLFDRTPQSTATTIPVQAPPAAAPQTASTYNKFSSSQPTSIQRSNTSTYTSNQSTYNPFNRSNARDRDFSQLDNNGMIENGDTAPARAIYMWYVQHAPPQLRIPQFANRISLRAIMNHILNQNKYDIPSTFRDLSHFDTAVFDGLLSVHKTTATIIASQAPQQQQYQSNPPSSSSSSPSSSYSVNRFTSPSSAHAQYPINTSAPINNDLTFLQRQIDDMSRSHKHALDTLTSKIEALSKHHKSTAPAKKPRHAAAATHTPTVRAPAQAQAQAQAQASPDPDPSEEEEEEEEEDSEADIPGASILKDDGNKMSEDDRKLLRLKLERLSVKNRGTKHGLHSFYFSFTKGVAYQRREQGIEQLMMNNDTTLSELLSQLT
jgi:hypothetical protein